MIEIEYLPKITEKVVEIQDTLEPSIFDILTGIASIVSGVLACGIFFSLWWHYSQQKISKKSQKLIFDDLLRHLHRNCVVIEAMSRDWEFLGYDKVTPCEDVFLKCQMLPSDLNLARFGIGDSHLRQIHELELLLRNYNIVAESASKLLDKTPVPFDAVLQMKNQLLRRADGIVNFTINLANDIGLDSLTPGYQTSEFYKDAPKDAKPSQDLVFEKDIAKHREITAKGLGNVFYSITTNSPNLTNLQNQN